MSTSEQAEPGREAGETPVLTRQRPIVVSDYREISTAGVQVELTAEDAEAIGAIEDPALSVDDAWDSTIDAHEFSDKDSRDDR